MTKIIKISLTGNDFCSTYEGIPRYNYELFKGLNKIKSIKLNLISLTRFPIMEQLFSHLITMPCNSLMVANKTDIFHATEPIVALSFQILNKPKIVTFHDIFCIKYKQNHQTPMHAKMIAPTLYKIIAEKCDLIIAVSSLTKHDLIKYLKVPDEKIRIINPGIDDIFLPLEIDKKNDFLSIGYLGGFVYRKRVDYLLKAFSFFINKYPSTKVKLILCGKINKHEYIRMNKIISKLCIKDYIIFKGYIPEKNIVKQYNEFDIFVFPSDYEGFGFPILEAQKCGIPVIVRGDSQLPDEVSKYCIKAYSEEEIADKMFELLINLDIRRDIIDKGLVHSKSFTWKKTIEKTIKVYQDVLGVK